MNRLLVAALVCLIPSFAFAADCPDLTLAQRWAGYVFSLEFLKVLSIGVVAAGVLFVFQGWIALIVEKLKYALNALGFVMCAALVACAPWVGHEYQLWPLLVACVLFAANIFFTIALYELKGDSPVGVCAILTVAWGAITAYFSEPVIGFLTAGAFMGLLGFSVIVDPLCYSFGFDSRDSTAKATWAALILVAAFVVQKVLFPTAPAYVQVFATGALWFGSFVAGTGLLIMSDKWYYDWFYRDSAARWFVYSWNQLMMIAACVGGIIVGNIFGISAVANTAAVFFVAYLVAKPHDIPRQSLIGMGFAFIASGAILGACWYELTTNETFVRTILH